MIDVELNRETLARRLGWPAGALEAVRESEQRFPGWRVWYTDGLRPNPQPGYGARSSEWRTWVDGPSLFGRTLAELEVKIRGYVSPRRW
jgi:hypothetical protein